MIVIIDLHSHLAPRNPCWHSHENNFPSTPCWHTPSLSHGLGTQTSPMAIMTKTNERKNIVDK